MLSKKSIVSMEKIIEKINKLSLPVVILVTSIILGGFYFASQVNKQRSIERQQQIKIERERQVREEAERALDDCLTTAESNYFDGWHRECKRLGKLTSKCIDINELSFDEYLEKYRLTAEKYVKERNLTPTNPGNPHSIRVTASFDYYVVKRASDECSCPLPIITVDRFNESLEKDKAECFKRYPQ